MNNIIKNAPLDELLDLAKERFQVGFETVAAAGERVEVLQIVNMQEYVEALANFKGEGPLELPFWAKIWPSSLLLGHYLDHLPNDGHSLLEIGAGIGVTGLIAAKKGFQVTLSDVDENALLFGRINILKNGLEDKARVVYVDFTTTSLDQRFDYILGCEVLYREDAYRPLVKFLLHHLEHKPEAEIVLALDYIRKAKKFFQLADREFMMQQQTVGCKGGEDGSERHLCTIHRLKPKKQL